jgi:ankyrin repeat protein
MDFYDTLLSYAVKEDNEEMVRLLLKGGADINRSTASENYRGHSPLTRAIAGDNMDMVRLLLEAGAGINAPGEYGNGPLQEALRKNNTTLAMDFLAMGADVNPPSGTPPLFLAAGTGNVPLMLTLLNRGADLQAERGGTVLTYATQVQDGALFKAMLLLFRERGLSDVDFHGEESLTALQAACRYNNIEAAKILLEEGADLNAGSAEGRTPLYYAIGENENRLPLIELLINVGADVNVLGPEASYYPGYSWSLTGRFTHLMLNYESPKVIELLLDAKAEVDARDSEGRTALMLHSFFGSAHIVTLLIEAGADVNAKNNYGETALLYALRSAGYGGWDILKALLEAGADINAQTNTGDTPLMFAMNYSSAKGIQALIEAGARENAQDNNGVTALMKKLAAFEDGSDNSYWYYNRNTAMEETAALLENALAGNEQSRAAVNLKDKYGWTALMYAAANRYVPDEALELLVRSGADVNAETPEGVTALMIRRSAVLLRAGAVERPPVVFSIPYRMLYSRLYGTGGMYQGDR